MFLSSRAIGQANITRDYLHKLVQSGYKMPGGPVIISPHGLLPSLYRRAGPGVEGRAGPGVEGRSLAQRWGRPLMSHAA